MLETSQYTYTRRKSRESQPPSAKSSFAWRWNGANEPDEVVRSPIDPEIWVTPQERKAAVSRLVSEGWAFKHRRGSALVPPHEGVLGWRKLNGRGRRWLHEYSKNPPEGWRQVSEHRAWDRY